MLAMHAKILMKKWNYNFIIWGGQSMKKLCHSRIRNQQKFQIKINTLKLKLVSI